MVFARFSLFLDLTRKKLLVGSIIRLTKAGGAVGIITAMIAYYIGVSELLEAEAKPIVVLPRGVLHAND